MTAIVDYQGAFSVVQIGDRGALKVRLDSSVMGQEAPGTRHLLKLNPSTKPAGLGVGCGAAVTDTPALSLSLSLSFPT